MRVHLRDVLAAIPERRPAGQHLVEDAAEGVDVGAGVDALTLDLLGRDVVERADEPAGRGQRGAARLVEPLRQAEVGQEGVLGRILALPRLDEDVAGLDVAMDETARVSDVEGTSDLCQQRRRARGVDRPARDQEAPQVGAVDQVHGHEEAAVLLPRVMDRNDVGMAQRHRDPRLRTEALAEGLVGGELG
ncbi:MAG: hypothetical protein R2700_08020 [Solirubrobacterales bacterium]